MSQQTARNLRIKRTRAPADVSSFTLKSNRKRNDISRQAEDDDVYSLHGVADLVVPTPYNLQTIAEICEKSNILPQCIDAMVTNIALNGYKVVPVSDAQRVNVGEKKLLESFIDSANSEESLTGVISKLVRQYEKYGFGFMEAIRNRRGEPTLLRAAKTASIRIMRKNGDPIMVTTQVFRGGKRSTVKELRRFRKYVQEVGTTKVFFKEFGDPRRMSYITGQYESADYKVPPGEEATELLHRRQYSEDVYGLPRWISQLPAILGSREAEEVNLRYFEDNTVPPMILTVAGGRLTRQSFMELTQLLNARGVGQERQNQILLIEAVPEITDIDGKGSVSLNVHKLTDARQSDGLFKDYDDANMAKVRSAFRLPPVVLGMSQDITFATANVSAYLAEVQVFQPERRMHDEWLNKNFVNHELGLNLNTVKLESKTPTITNPEAIIKSLTALNVMGGLTPRTAVNAFNETLQLTLPQYPEEGEEEYEEWMDMPIQLATRLMMGSTQQTGEGDSTHADESSKSPDVKEQEDEGDVEPSAPEHGQE
jgi:PBSX family phage portal protein